MKRRLGLLFLESVLWVVSLVILVPLAMVLLNSLKDVVESAVMSLHLPSTWHLENYLVVVGDGRMIRAFGNSVFISGTSSVLTVLSSAMAAYVLSRHRTRVNLWIYMLFLLGLVAPINFIATIKVMQALAIINTYTGTILLYSALNIPFAIFLYFGFMRSVPRELEEAAIIDGCSPLRIFFLVVFPLLKPVTVTVFVITFLACWNDFILPLYFLNSSYKWGMIMSMYNYFSQYTSSWNLVAAAMVLNLIPIIVIYFLGQKYIVSGMTAGSVKG